MEIFVIKNLIYKYYGKININFSRLGYFVDLLLAPEVDCDPPDQY